MTIALTTASLLPPNATPLERALDLLAQIRLGAIDTPFRALWSPQDCPEAVLPWLAWALSIDQWDSAWPLNIRRARVASAIAIQRRKGTRQSVADVVNSFGGNVVIREWWEKTPPATPHTFSLTVSLGGQSDAVPGAEFIDAVISEVARTKPARSHFDFTVGLSARGRLGLRAMGRAATYARLPCIAA
ncbi:phage tail protein I [Novosphingobium sp. UBA1939]|uniref:phage tail protein I n=1 Tax=Novosphingobium sp. UBA1939 TaxID=1946982 RepID=UPI0025F2111A|nr:phage tail protein I [Novosphingobium sp. UBA1939]